MSTTTIRLSEELKQRIALAADRAGISSHHFIIQAVEEKTRQQETMDNFRHEADIRFAKLLKTGESLQWSDVKALLEKKIGRS